MGKTIKQIADEIGVSKQAIHQKRKKEPLSTNLQPFTETIDRVIYISVDGEKLIKEAFGIKNENVNSSIVYDNKFTQKDGELKRIIDILEKQIDSKDNLIQQQQKSINELTAALENTTESLKASQALHAGTMQKQLQESESEKEEIEVVEEKQTFWQKLFSKKE